MNKEVAHLRTGPPLGQQRVGAPPIRDWPAPLSTNQRALARSRGGPANRGQERPFSSTRALTKLTGHWAIYKAWAWNILIYAPNTGALSAKNTICSWFQAKALPRAFWALACFLAPWSLAFTAQVRQPLNKSHTLDSHQADLLSTSSISHRTIF